MLLALLLLALPAKAEEEALRVIFVGASAGEGFSERTISTIDELVVSSLAAQGRLEVIGRAELQQIIGQEIQRQMAGCDETQCMEEIADAAGITYVATADVGRLGGRTVVTLKILDSVKARVVARAQQLVASDSELPEAIDRLVRELSLRFADSRGEVPSTTNPPLPDTGPSAYVQATPLLTIGTWGGEIGFGGGWDRHWLVGVHFARGFLFDFPNTNLDLFRLRLERVLRTDAAVQFGVGGSMFVYNTRATDLTVTNTTGGLLVEASMWWRLLPGISLGIDLPIGGALPTSTCEPGYRVGDGKGRCLFAYPIFGAVLVGARGTLEL